MEILKNNITAEKAKKMPMLNLAFIGDAVHTLYVRNIFCNSVDGKIGTLHKMTSDIVKASSQCKVLNKILPLLDDELLEIVRRARNTKSNNIAKNSNIEEYKQATSFEAVIGFLYLTEDDRLNKFLQMSMEEK